MCKSPLPFFFKFLSFFPFLLVPKCDFSSFKTICKTGSDSVTRFCFRKFGCQIYKLAEEVETSFNLGGQEGEAGTRMHTADAPVLTGAMAALETNFRLSTLKSLAHLAVLC